MNFHIRPGSGLGFYPPSVQATSTVHGKSNKKQKQLRLSAIGNQQISCVVLYVYDGERLQAQENGDNIESDDETDEEFEEVSEERDTVDVERNPYT